MGNRFFLFGIGNQLSEKVNEVLIYYLCSKDSHPAKGCFRLCFKVTITKLTFIYQFFFPD